MGLGKASNGGDISHWHQVEKASSLQVDDLMQACSCRKSGCKSCKCESIMKWACLLFVDVNERAPMSITDIKILFFKSLLVFRFRIQ